jgi:hypothetical protein
MHGHFRVQGSQISKGKHIYSTKQEISQNLLYSYRSIGVMFLYSVGTQVEGL